MLSWSLVILPLAPVPACSTWVIGRNESKEGDLCTCMALCGDFSHCLYLDSQVGLILAIPSITKIRVVPTFYRPRNFVKFLIKDQWSFTDMRLI